MAHFDDYERKLCPMCEEYFFTRHGDTFCSDICKLSFDRILNKSFNNLTDDEAKRGESHEDDD